MQAVKEKYQKPTLVSIQLIPGENVLGICQDGTGTGNYSLTNYCQYGDTFGCQDAT